jgi:hypothetical protein
MSSFCVRVQIILHFFRLFLKKRKIKKEKTLSLQIQNN